MRRPTFTGLLLVLSVIAGPALAQDKPPAVTLLIENVRLVTGEEGGEDLPVNLVIRDRKLDIVSRDELPVEEFTLTFDANGGFLLGRLEIGESPSFVIFDVDPRVDQSVLRDSKPHVRLAIEDGDVVENRLTVKAVTAETSASGRQTSGWLAYNPPPLALPSSYLDTTKWNRWETRAVSGIFTAGLVLDRMRWVSQDGTSEAQVGDLDDFSGGEIRGFRFGVVGTLNFPAPWVYTIFGATHAFDSGFDQDRDDSFEWFDLRLDIPLRRGVTLSVGKQKEPISLERLTPLIFLPMQERSAFIDAMLPARNTGIVFSGTGLGERMTWAGGVFNNFLDADESLSDAATQLIGRVTGLPFVSADRSNLLHLGIGYRYSNAKLGARFLSEPEFNNSPVFVDTTLIGDAKDFYTVDLEAAWRRGPLMVTGEYVQTEVKSATAQDPSFSGWYVSGVWALTGEMRKYNPKGGIFGRPPVSKSVYQNGIGAWELLARYSRTDLTDGTISGGELDVWSAGLRWWLTPFMNLDVNYRYTTLDGPGLSGDPTLADGNSAGINGRLVLLLE